LQALGFLAFTLPAVVILMPTKKPQGQELSREQHRANQALNQRRLRIEHVDSLRVRGMSVSLAWPLRQQHHDRLV